MLKGSETALADPQKLRQFIEPHNPEAARRAAEALKKGAAILIDHPGLGRRLDERTWLRDCHSFWKARICHALSA